VALTTFILLKGKHPFKTGISWSESDQIKSNWNYKLDDVSLEARDFIMRCGSAKRFERPDIRLALVHPFITKSKISVDCLLDYKSKPKSALTGRFKVCRIGDSKSKFNEPTTTNENALYTPGNSVSILDDQVETASCLRQAFQGLL
jgi:serine/threonine protein kinase